MATLGLQFTECTTVLISLRQASGSAVVSEWEVKRSLRLALATLPSLSVAHEAYHVAQNGAGTVLWRIPGNGSNDAEGAYSEADKIPQLLWGKILRVAARGGVASIAVSDVQATTFASALEQKQKGACTSTVKIERVPAAWVDVKGDGVVEQGALAMQFAEHFGRVRVCECVLRKSEDLLLPLEVDMCVQYDGEDEAWRAAKFVEHCVVTKAGGGAFVFAPTAKFVSDELLSEEALAGRARQRENQQKQLVKLEKERQKCQEELLESSASVQQLAEETSAAREALRDHAAVSQLDECITSYLQHGDQVQQALDSDASREKLKAARYKLKDALRDVLDQVQHVREAYQAHQAQLELEERAAMTAQMREAGRKFLTDVDDYTVRRKEIFARAHQSLVVETSDASASNEFDTASAAVLEAVRHAEARMQGYTALAQICGGLMNKDTVFTDKYLQGIGDYLQRCMQEYRHAKPHIDLIEDLLQFHLQNCARAEALANETHIDLKQPRQSRSLLQQCVKLFHDGCIVASQLSKDEVTPDVAQLDSIRAMGTFAGYALDTVLACQSASSLFRSLDALQSPVSARNIPQREMTLNDELCSLAGGRMPVLQYLQNEDVQLVAPEVDLEQEHSERIANDVRACKNQLSELDATAAELSSCISDLLPDIAKAGGSTIRALRQGLEDVCRDASALEKTIESAQCRAERSLMDLEDQLSTYRRHVEMRARSLESKASAQERKEMGIEDRRSTTLRRVEQLQNKKRNLEKQLEMDQKRLRPETKEFEHEGILLLRPAWELVEAPVKAERSPETKPSDREAELREKLLAQALKRKFRAA